METIGLIGIGVMGRTVAVKVIEGGYPVLACGVSPACIEKARALGASIAPTLADVARQAKIILMLLPGPDDVTACVAGPDGLIAASLPRNGARRHEHERPGYHHQDDRPSARAVE